MYQGESRFVHPRALVAHTAAVINNQAHANGNIFALEDRQFLFDFVLVDAEIILGQAVDKFAAIVEHTGVQNHQVHIGDDSSLLAGWRSGWDCGWPGGGGAAFVTGTCADAVPANNAKINKNKEASGAQARSSVGRGVIAGLGVDRKGREAFGRVELNLDFAPARVVDVIAWFVSQYILVAQLHADLGRNVRQII